MSLQETQMAIMEADLIRIRREIAQKDERIAALESQLAESEKARERMREALEAFVAAQAMSNYGEYSKIDWQRPNTTFHKEWGGGDCEKHGRWYGSGCICCDEDWKKLKKRADHEAGCNRDDALRAASGLAVAALAAEKGN